MKARDEVGVGGETAVPSFAWSSSSSESSSSSSETGALNFLSIDQLSGNSADSRGEMVLDERPQITGEKQLRGLTGQEEKQRLPHGPKCALVRLDPAVVQDRGREDLEVRSRDIWRVKMKPRPSVSGEDARGSQGRGLTWPAETDSSEHIPSDLANRRL